jgi:biotin carboxylase
VKFSMVEVSLTASDPQLPSVSMDVLHGAKKLGAETVVYAADPAAYAAMPHGVVDRWVRCDTRDADAVAAAARTVMPDCLVGVSDLFVDTANRAALKLGLPANADSPAFARDKAAVRAALDDAGVRNLTWAVIDCAGRADTQVPGHVRLPAIAKPVDGSASWDITSITSMDQLQAALEHHRARRTYGRGVAPAGRLLIEEEVPGELYSAEGFRHDGRTDVWGYTGRVLSDPPTYIELAMSFGADEPVPGLGDYVEQVLDATRFAYGAFHIEVMSSPTGPVLIEINARPMGHGCHQCVNALADRPLGDEIARRYLGLDRAIRIADGAATIGHHVAERGGTITSIGGVADARHCVGVVAVNLSKKVGDTVTLTGSNSDCIAHAIAVGADRSDATKRAFHAIEHLRFEYAAEEQGHR